MRRGQTMVLMMLTMLLLVIMVCITLGISSRAREKADLQTMADLAALSNATATARTYNVASLLNRTMVSHYAAMTAIQAELAWVTETQPVLSRAANMAREMETPDPAAADAAGCQVLPWSTYNDCPPYWREDSSLSAPTCKTAEIKDASYELWHASLSNWNPTNGNVLDNVNGRCKNGNCTQPRSRLTPGMQELDREVAAQMADIHWAVRDLASIEWATYRKLSNAISTGALADHVIHEARGSSGGLAPFASAATEATDELDSATDYITPDQATRNETAVHRAAYMTSMAQAVMGTRISAIAIEHDRDQIPAHLSSLWSQVQSNLNRTYPGHWRLNLDPRTQDAHSSVVQDGIYPGVEGDSLDPVLPWSRMIYGTASLTVTVSFKDTCGDRRWHTKSEIVTTSAMSGGAPTNPKNVGPGFHNALHDAREGEVHTQPFRSCHDHVHYEEGDGDIHALGNDPLLPSEGIGFFFPHAAGPWWAANFGAKGAWGVPKLPVALHRAPQTYPWQLDLNFRLQDSSPGTKLDLTAAHDTALPALSAVSNGIAYYHRREHVNEPPNMLNPFWHATLVPLEIDTHGPSEGDPTAGGADSSGIAQVLPGNVDATSRAAYTALRPILRIAEDAP